MKKHAFTLLETVICLAIITMFFAISIPLFSKFTAGAKLDTAARNVASTLRTARSYAIGNRATYDVHFDTGSIPNEYNISDGTNVIDKRYKLPAGVSFQNIGFGKMATNTARFTDTGMLLEDAVSTSIEVTNTDGTGTKTITVDKTSGRVHIE